MTISANIIADTQLDGNRITTMELWYPRYIHSEFMTHRVFSRNAGSSRAIPVEKSISALISDPVIPSVWGLNQKGMQAQEAQAPADECERIWLEARDNAIVSARKLLELNVHKQHVNRLLEPFAHIRVVVTATGDVWEHFFRLRDHPDAQPEIKLLAQAMKMALAISTPREDKYHLPYVTEEERAQYGIEELLLISAARCARVSYRTHNGLVPRYDEDMELATRLWESLHLSPFEHPAVYSGPFRFANFVGFQSYRHRKGF